MLTFGQLTKGTRVVITKDADGVPLPRERNQYDGWRSYGNVGTVLGQTPEEFTVTVKFDKYPEERQCYIMRLELLENWVGFSVPVCRGAAGLLGDLS